MPDTPTTPTGPMGSDTKLAVKIGEHVARAMARSNPRSRPIPAHRWAQKLTRFAQRLVFLAFFVAGIKLKWPEYVMVALGLGTVRALAPDLADGILKWVLSAVKGAKESK